MIKVKTTADTYKSVVLRRAIIICWLLLFVCFALKIFGGNYFEIVVNSPKFVEFCQFLDSNIILYGLIGLISSLISYFFFYLALLKQLFFNKRQFFIYIISVFLFCVIRIIIEYKSELGIIATIINLIQCGVIPIFLGVKINKRGILRLIIGNVLNFLFQLIAVITKNIGLNFITESSLIAVIYMIDVYIMLCLYYLYSNETRKENTK